jgi:molybdate transport system permease protein
MLNKIFNSSIYFFTFFLVFCYLGLIILVAQRINFFDANIIPEVLFNAIKLSIFTSTVSAIISLFLSIPCAYCLSRKDFRFKNVIDTILDLPVILSPVAIGTMLLLFFDTFPGRFIEDNLIKFVFEKNGIILAQIFVITGLAIRLLKNTFDGINQEYEYISYTLGYNKIMTFFLTVLPIAKPGIISTLLLIWARAMGEFGASVVLAGATTFKTETIPVSIYLQLSSANINNMLILILILIIISSIILLLTRKLLGQK